jgi:hypothetical protein
MTGPDIDDEPPAELHLTAAEQGLWHACRDGSELDLSTGRLADDDPTSEEVRWGPERHIRGHVIVHLLLHGPTPRTGQAAAVRLKGASVTGAIDLSGADIVPRLELLDCYLESPLRLTGSVADSVHLRRCRIPRLEADGFTSRGSLHVDRCLLPGGIALQQAQIGMDLTLSHSVVKGIEPGGQIVSADGLAVAQDVNADGVTTVGEVSLRGARIGGDFTMRGSVLRNPGGTALNAPRITVDHQLVLAPGTELDLQTGEPVPAVVRKPRLEGRLCLDGGTFGTLLMLSELLLRSDGMLSLQRIQTPEFVFTPEPELRDGDWPCRVNVSNAQVGRLRDLPTSWPGIGALIMGGFRYETLAPVGSFSLSERIKWVLAGSPEFTPEPYDQLAAVLRAEGQDGEADHVMLAKLRMRRANAPASLKAWEYLQDWTFGYGYRPQRALVWIAVLWACGSVVFAHDPPRPLKPGEGPHWDPALYTLDLLLPIVDLGQASAWRPVGVYQFVAAELIVIGWLLATIVTAGAAKVIFRKS